MADKTRRDSANEVPIEKGGAAHVEYGSPGTTSPGYSRSLEDLEHLDINEKKLIRKLDLHIVPWLSLPYLLSFLDRTNIGNANLFGLSENLHLGDMQYALCLALFFVAYVIFEVPSNMVMKAWRPSMWLPTIMIAWGAVMIGMGFVRNFNDLIITRVLLGATESGLFPGVSFFLTQWYRRYEINFRIALFFSAATAAGAFGGLLARLINLMNGVAGYEGWRWIFILEGVLTVVLAAASFWMLYDYPDTAKFLKEDERKFVQRRLLLDNDGCSHEFKYKYVKDAFLDWKVWVSALMFQGGLMPVYCFSLFSPTLTANLGYTAATAQLMSVPPYVVAAVTTTFAGWLSDRMKRRGPITMICASIGALGYLLLLVTPNPQANYAGLFLAAAGCYPLIPLIVSWGANNCGGSLKKGVGAAIIVSVGNAGGVISSFLYPKKDKPRYFPGHATNFAYCVMTVCLAGFMTVYLSRQNKKKAARNAARTQEWTDEEKRELEDRADANDWFVYTT